MIIGRIDIHRADHGLDLVVALRFGNLKLRVPLKPSALRFHGRVVFGVGNALYRGILRKIPREKRARAESCGDQKCNESLFCALFDGFFAVGRRYEGGIESLGELGDQKNAFVVSLTRLQAIGQFRGIKILAEYGNDRFFMRLGELQKSPPFVVNPFCIQIFSGRADHDHHLCRFQRVVDIRLVIVSCDRVQRLRAEKDVVLSRKLIVYPIAEIDVIRSRLLEANEYFASARKFVLDASVFFLIILDQLCQSFVVCAISAVLAAEERFLVIFRAFTRLGGYVPEGRNGVSRFISVEDHVLFAEKLSPDSLFDAGAFSVPFDHAAVRPHRFVKFRFLPFVKSVSQIGVDRLALQILGVPISAGSALDVISRFLALRRAAGRALK